MSTPQWGSPGFTELVESGEWEGIFAGRNHETLTLEEQVTIDSTATDAGNTPTSTLRGGLVMARQDADGNYYAYDADAADGTQFASHILPQQLDMRDGEGTVEDKEGFLLYSRGNLKAAELTGLDLAAKRMLRQRGFLFDSQTGSDGLPGHNGVQTHSTSTKTLDADDNGRLIIATAVLNVTLPTLATVGVGWKCEILQSADANLVITAAANTLIYGDAGGALSTTLTFSTANEIMGSRVELEVVYTATSTLLWAVKILTNNTVVAA